jgi:hypothetical protein
VLGSLEPSLDTASSSVRSAYQPLNLPPPTATPEQADAARQASMEAFHLAMLVSAGLLVIGSAVSWFGLRGEPAADLSTSPTRAAAPAE